MEEGKKLSLSKRIMSMNVSEKIKLATKGNKEARGILMRDSNKLVSVAVIRSPRITDGEVLGLAQSKILHRRRAARHLQQPRVAPEIRHQAGAGEEPQGAPGRVDAADHPARARREEPVEGQERARQRADARQEAARRRRPPSAARRSEARMDSSAQQPGAGTGCACGFGDGHRDGDGQRKGGHGRRPDLPGSSPRRTQPASRAPPHVPVPASVPASAPGPGTAPGSVSSRYEDAPTPTQAPTHGATH